MQSAGQPFGQELGSDRWGAKVLFEMRVKFDVANAPLFAAWGVREC
jgi:hypothetical protein